MIHQALFAGGAAAPSFVTGSSLFFADAAYDYVRELVLETPWDLSTASESSRRLSTASQFDVIWGLHFSPDGSLVFVSGLRLGQAFRVAKYALSTPWNLSTGSYVNEKDLSAQISNGRALAFDNGGTRMYVTHQLGNGDDVVAQYNLGAAWDITTATWNSQLIVTGTGFLPADIHFKPDGTKFYLTGERGTTDDVRQWTLSNAWEISSGTYDSIRKQVTAQDGQPRGLALSDSGTKMCVHGELFDKIYQYTLSTAWNVSTATYDSVSVSVPPISPSTDPGLANALTFGSTPQ